MVEVFKTNISGREQAEKLIESLLREFPSCKITMDMTDCDRILRIESTRQPIEAKMIVNFVTSEFVETHIEMLSDG